MSKSTYPMRFVNVMLLLMLGVSLFSIPTFAWYGPPYDGPVGTEDGRFEMFGPRVDSVLIKMYPSAEAEWEALKAGEIDITDWKLTKAYYDEFMSGAYPDIAVADSGGELSMYVLDMNNSPWRNADGDCVVGDEGDVPNPFGDETFIVLEPEHPYTPGANVTRGSQARLALAHLIDRDAIINAAGVMCNPMYTHIPESPVFRVGGWINDDVNKYSYDPSIAAQILDMAGYLDSDGNGWREDPRNPGVDMTLEFYTRLDAFRTALGDWVQNALTVTLLTIGPTYAGIKVNRHPVTGGGAWSACMVEQRHSMYTAGWIWSREPTLCYFIYNSEFYWGPGGDPPNYNWVRDSEIDRLSELAYTAQDTQTAKQAVLDFQTRMNEPDAVFNIPVANTVVKRAFKKTDSRGALWKGFINSAGYGINTALSQLGGVGISTALSQLDTFLNAHPEDMATGGTIHYGWSQDWAPSSLNPYHWDWYWDSEILNRIYSALIAVNPYNPLGDGPGDPNVDLPWIAKSWEIGTTPAGNSKFTFYLRDDVYFHDGTRLTAKDIYYTVQFGHWQATDHPEYGGFWEWGLPPTWWGNIMDLTPEFDAAGNVVDTPGVGVDMPDGPDGYTIVFNYNVKILWAFWWCATGIPITPKHKWWDRFVPDLRGSDGFCPDPQIIGTGPFKVYPGNVKGDGTDPEHYTPGSHIKLDKNPTFFRSYQVPVTATVNIQPDALNLWSRGKWITTYIELPEGYDISSIDVSSLLLNGTITADPVAPTQAGDHDGDGRPDLMVKFCRTAVILFIISKTEIEEFAWVTLTITGILYDGTLFKGSCAIRMFHAWPRGHGRIIPI